MSGLPDLSKVDPYSRHQPGLTTRDLWPPRDDGLCVCGCGEQAVYYKHRWSGRECQRRAWVVLASVKSAMEVVRPIVFDRDGGVCAECGVSAELWHADHIVPIGDGGGGCGLDGYQTLCEPCHHKKTAEEAKVRRPKMRNRGIPMPDELWAQIRALSLQAGADRGRTMSASEWIRGAIQDAIAKSESR